MKCVICDVRPVKKGKGHCSTCEQRYKLGESRDKQTPEKFATYKGYVVGFFRRDNGRLKPRLLKRSPDSLPKRNPEKVIRLDSYCEGFSREQVKSLKSAILRLAEPRAKVVRVQ